MAGRKQLRRKRAASPPLRSAALSSLLPRLHRYASLSV